MIRSIHLFSLVTLLFSAAASGQQLSLKDLSSTIDSFLQTKTIRPFNGVIIVTQNDKVVYEKCAGYADFALKTPLTFKSQFVVGSVSKQITAVLILREMDKGTLDLHTPVRKYLPKLQPAWADTVTVFQLLNHTSGIMGYDKPLEFVPGTRFSYSGMGYYMLGDIIEAVSGKPYTEMVIALFKKCGMKNSVDPRLSKKKKLVKGNSRQKDGSIQSETTTFDNNNVPAGLLISSPRDLILWNKNLHGGKLLKEETYRQMITPSAKRKHPVFGEVGYGLGIQIDDAENVTDYGHGGYAPGFVTSNFYFPATKTSLVVMENLDWKAEDFKQTFFFETGIRNLVRKASK